jgi:hypothetical protein
MVVSIVLLVLAILVVLLFDGPVTQKLARIGGLFALFQVLLALVRWLIGAS